MGQGTSGDEAAAAEVRDLERRLADLDELHALAHVGAWTYDPAASRIWWNDELYRIHGYQPGAFAPTADLVRRTVEPADFDRVFAAYNGLRVGEDSGPVQYRIRRTDGTIRHLLGYFRLAGGTAGPRLIGVAIDVTTRKHAEEREERAHRLESLGLIASGVAHDVNNILTIIQASADVARRAKPPAAIDRLLLEILGAVRSATELTRPLLTFARGHGGEPTAVRPPEVIAGLAPLLHRVAGDRVALVIEAHVHGVVRVDRSRLEQAVVNLVANAREAMPDGGRVTVRLESRTVPAREDGEAAEHIVVSVIDDGPGMDDETARRAFDPFFTTKPTGSGLGLATCFAFATQAGGTAWLETSPGGGTAVHLALPAVPRPITPAPRGVAATTPGRGERVLVVDDDDLVRTTVVAVLEDLGFVALAVASAEEALAALDAGAAVDAVLTDVEMPGMDGFALAERLRGTLPVVLMSGHVRAPHLRPPAFAAVDWLAKPFSTPALVDALLAAVGRPR